MGKLILFFSFFLLSFSFAYSQGVTRAVVIGVSKYQNFPADKQLKYAHKDATSFFNLVKSGILGPIDEDNVSLLVNEDATEEEALFLIKEALVGKNVKSGDRAVIYFAGHGDVHADNKNGFLLAYNAPSDGDYFLGGALELNKVSQYIESGSQKGVKTIMVSDACRSGSVINKLGSQFTIQAIANLFENSLQLLSCGADQSSQEDCKWGGGHGVFTFYLVKGLAGEADMDNDQVIRFFELGNYLRMNVPKETDFRQIPNLFGKDAERIAEIEDALKVELEKLKMKGDCGNGNCLGEASVIFEILEGLKETKTEVLLDDDTKQKLEKYKQQLKQGNLLRPGSFYNWKATKNIPKAQQDILEKGLTRSYPIHDNMAMALAFSDKHNLLVSASDDSTIKVIDAKSFEVKKTIKPHWGGVLCVQISPDGKYLASGSWDETVRIEEISSGKSLFKLEGHQEDIRGLDFNEKGDKVVSVGIDGKIIIWDVTQGLLSQQKSFPSKRFNTVEWVRKANLLVVADEKGEVMIVDAATLQVKKSIKAAGANVSTGISPDEKMLYIGSQMGLEYYTFPEGVKKGIVKEKVQTRKIYSSNGWLTAPNEKSIIIYDPLEPKRAASFVFEGEPQASIALQGDLLVYTDSKGSLRTVQMNKIKKDVVYDHAFDLYVSFLEMDEMKSQVSRLGGRLAFTLEIEAQKVINKISHGDKILPTQDELALALEQLELANYLTQDDPVMGEKINSKILLVKGYTILLSNDKTKYDEAIRLFEKINQYEPNAAYQYDAIGVAYQRKNEIQKSKQNLEKAKERVPVWTTPRANLAESYYREGKYSDAMTEYNGIIDLVPDKSKGYTGMGDIHLAMGNLDEAEQYFSVSAMKDTNDAYIYNRIGDVAYIKGDVSKAKKSYLKSVSIDSTFVGNYVDLAKVVSNKDSSSKYIKKAETLSGTDPTTITEIADYYATGPNKDLEKSKSLYKKTLDIDPYNVKAYDGLTTVLIETRNEDEAKSVVTNAEKQLKNSPQTNVLLAHFYKRTGKNDEAEKELKKAIDKSPGYYDAYVGLMEIYSEDPSKSDSAQKLLTKADVEFKGFTSKLQSLYQIVDKGFKPKKVVVPAYANAFSLPAQEVRTVDEETMRQSAGSDKFKAVLEKNPDLETDFQTMAFVHTLFGEYYQAEQYLSKHTEAKGADFDTKIQLGEIEQLRYRTKAAIEAYADAAKLQPDNSKPLLRIAKMVTDSTVKWDLIKKAEASPQKDYEDFAALGFFYLYDKKDFATAKKMFINSRKTNPYYEEAIYGFAEMYRLQGKNDKGLAEMNNAINALPIAPEPYYLMGRFEEAIGNPDKAVTFYNRALKHEPFYLKSYIALVRLSGSKDIKATDELYSKASERFPESSELNYVYSKILVDNGLLEQAEELVKISISHDINFIPQYHLAEQIYQKQGNTNFADKINTTRKEKSCEGCEINTIINGLSLKGIVSGGKFVKSKS